MNVMPAGLAGQSPPRIAVAAQGVLPKEVRQSIFLLLLPARCCPFSDPQMRCLGRGVHAADPRAASWRGLLKPGNGDRRCSRDGEQAEYHEEHVGWEEKPQLMRSIATNRIRQRHGR